jgi:hypothetical protein
MKNVDWRAAEEEEPFPPKEEEIFLPRSVILKIVYILEGRRNKVSPEEPTDGRRGWQNTSAHGKSYKAQSR